jgi:hypothetical protein
MRAPNKPSAALVRTTPLGKHGDGGGLWLHKAGKEGGKWILLVTVHGQRREMGLGAYPETPLKEARSEAEKLRVVVREGKDPVKERPPNPRSPAQFEYSLRCSVRRV